jgi:hypothetical protein
VLTTFQVGPRVYQARSVHKPTPRLLGTLSALAADLETGRGLSHKHNDWWYRVTYIGEVKL